MLGRVGGRILLILWILIFILSCGLRYFFLRDVFFERAGFERASLGRASFERDGMPFAYMMFMLT